MLFRSLLRVDEVGLATVQDGGRWGWAHVGVPVAGAQHRARCLVATGLILGRLDERAPAVELLDGRLVATARQGVAICVVGPATVEVDGFPAALGAVVAVDAGSTIRIAPPLVVTEDEVGMLVDAVADALANP